jgi:hypothetical protein
MFLSLSRHLDEMLHHAWGSVRDSSSKGVFGFDFLGLTRYIAMATELKPGSVRREIKNQETLDMLQIGVTIRTSKLLML